MAGWVGSGWLSQNGWLSQTGWLRQNGWLSHARPTTLDMAQGDMDETRTSMAASLSSISTVRKRWNVAPSSSETSYLGEPSMHG